MKKITLNRQMHIFFLMPLSVLIIAFAGIGVGSVKVYSDIITMITKSEEVEIPFSYIDSKIKRSIDNSVEVKNLEGSNVIILEDEYEEEIYQTWIYCYEGYLYEAFMLRGMDFSLQDGIKIMKLDKLDITYISPRLLQLKTVTSDQNQCTKLIKVKEKVD